MALARSIPNLLTALRIALAVLVFCALAAAASGAVAGRGPLITAFVAFTVGSATDYLDGWLARRLDAQSVWGAILDPIADKIAVLAVVLGLMWLQPRVGIAAPGFLILMRELFVSGLREAGAARGLAFPVTRLAKWKTAVQLAALCIVLLAAAVAPPPWLARTGDRLLWLAAALTLWTGGQYALAAQRQLGKA